MDVRSARAHGASPEGGDFDEVEAKPGAKALGYLGLFQVTRCKSGTDFSVPALTDIHAVSLPITHKKAPLTGLSE